MRERIIRYKGNDLIVYFTIDRCTHVAECIKGLPRVFDTTKRPWINTEGASADEIAEVIVKCPTGALHFKRSDGGSEERPPEKNIFRTEKDGPLYLHGDIEVQNSDGTVVLQDTRLAFCRCGGSAIKPLCDGKHEWLNFKDDGEIKGGRKAGQASSLPHHQILIKLTPNGPLIVQGPFELQNHDKTVSIYGNKAAFCRCGASKKMPFCDGSHQHIHFKTKAES